MISEAKKKANAKYNKKTYAMLGTMVRKEEKEAIRNWAEGKGLSLSGYIISLIEDDCPEFKTMRERRGSDK